MVASQLADGCRHHRRERRLARSWLFCRLIGVVRHVVKTTGGAAAGRRQMHARYEAAQRDTLLVYDVPTSPASSISSSRHTNATRGIF